MNTDDVLSGISLLLETHNRSEMEVKSQPRTRTVEDEDESDLESPIFDSFYNVFENCWITELRSQNINFGLNNIFLSIVTNGSYLVIFEQYWKSAFIPLLINWVRSVDFGMTKEVFKLFMQPAAQTEIIYSSACSRQHTHSLHAARNACGCIMLIIHSNGCSRRHKYLQRLVSCF